MARTSVAAAAASARRPPGFTEDHVAEVVNAEGSKDITPPDPQAVLAAADAIMEREIGILDVVRALCATGFEEEAGRVFAMGRARVAGDYLQTAAIFDEQMNVLSKVTDPNDYQGPGTGYEVPAARREQMAGIRQQRSRADLLARHADGAAPSAGRVVPPSAARPREAPTRSRSASASRPRSRPGCGSRCRGCRSSRRWGRSWPASSRRAASRASSGCRPPSTSA